MKSKTWAIVLGGLFLTCVMLSIWLLWPTNAARAEIWSEGKLVETLDLSTDRTIEVKTDSGTNTVTVFGGKIAVTAASCPDKYCIHRGFCSGGAQIVCLPNRLVIRFVGASELDGIVG